MSPSAALEYGFPSTHCTNAVSVTVYTLFHLTGKDSALRPDLKIFFLALLNCYAISIILGRLYCGMHGFLDVAIGSGLGALLFQLQYWFGQQFNLFIDEGSYKALALLVLVVLVLVRLHPQPADDCPCFDDSVAFAGVIIGVESGLWRFARGGLVPYSLEALGCPRTVARIVVGVLMIYAWRGTMKPTLHQALPPIFRVFEKLGLDLPRRFFVQAS